MMKRWLIFFGLWIAKLGGWNSPIPDDVLEFARDLVNEQQTEWPERDSETKRASVYRSLVNAFPKEAKRTLSLAIEEAICLDC